MGHADEHKSKSVSISVGGNVGGDVVAGDKTMGDKVGGDKITGTEPSSAQAELLAALSEWKREIETKIEALAELDADEKTEIRQKAEKIETELAKGPEADVGKLERLINTLSVMAPDILEVTAKILQNPLAGVGLVLKKIGDRAKLEREAASAG